jgi:hypothetical protein
MTGLALVILGILATALVAALVLARLVGPRVWWGALAGLVLAAVLIWQTDRGTAHDGGVEAFLSLSVIVAPALIGWVIGALIGLRLRPRRGAE